MTRRQSIAKPPMEDSYGRLHMNIDVREIKQVVNILHIHLVHCNRTGIIVANDCLALVLCVLWIVFKNGELYINI